MPDSALDAIFKAYDVRGIYPDELDESIARRIGNAFVAFTGSARVLVGPRRPAVVGPARRGVHRGRDAGRAPTSSTSASPPPTSATSRAGSLDAPAAMFTASHNPAAVQRRQVVPGRRAADRPGHRARARSRPWSRAGSSSGPRTRAAPSRATCCPRSSRTSTRSSTSTRSHRCGSSPTPPTASAG